MSYETIVTTAGRAALAAAIANNQPLPITGFAVGDGDGEAVTPAENIGALVNSCYSGTPARLSVPDSSGNQVAIECVVPATSGGYTVREIGIFSNNTLICYGSTPEIVKPLLEDGAVGDLILTVTMTISNADAVTLAVDPGVAVATRQYVDIAGGYLYDALAASEAKSIAREKLLRRDLAYYDGLHITERLSRLRSIHTAASGMIFNGLALGNINNESFLCVAYSDSNATDGGVDVHHRTGTFATAISGSPCFSVCYGDGMFLVGSSGKIYYNSEEPSVSWQWHELSLNTNYPVKKIVYNGHLFLTITGNTLLKITKNGDDLAAVELVTWTDEPKDIAIDPNTGHTWLVGCQSHGGPAPYCLDEINTDGWLLRDHGLSFKAEHLFYSEPCACFIVYDDTHAYALELNTEKSLTPVVGIISGVGGGVNLIVYAQEGNNNSTDYYYKTALRRFSGVTVSAATLITSGWNSGTLFLLDGLLFAMSADTIWAE